MKRFFTELTNGLRQINWKKRNRKPANRGRGRRQPLFVPCLEVLEDRFLLTTFFVATTVSTYFKRWIRESITI